jgi:hypothetical protein
MILVGIEPGIDFTVSKAVLDIEEHVARETEGLFLACYLALHDDV